MAVGREDILERVTRHLLFADVFFFKSDDGEVELSRRGVAGVTP